MPRCGQCVEYENGRGYGGLEMNEQAKEMRRAYKRAWNAKNKDKVKAAQQRYWERKAQAAQEKQEAQAN